MTAPHDGAIGDARKRREELAAGELHDEPHQQHDRSEAPQADGQDDQQLGTLGIADQGMHGASVGAPPAGGLGFEEIRARLEAATPGPWVAHVLGSEGYDVRADRPKTPGRLSRLRVARCGYEEWETDKANAEFIAHARTDIPLLLAALDEAEEERDYWHAVADAHRQRLRGTVTLRGQEPNYWAEWHRTHCAAAQGAFDERARAEVAESVIASVRELVDRPGDSMGGRVNLVYANEIRALLPKDES